MAEEEMGQEAPEAQEHAQTEEHAVDPMRQEFEQLKQTTAQMDHKISKLLSSIEPKPQARGLTPEQKAELAKNPEAMFHYFENENRRVSQEVESKTARSEWDSKAYSDFPALKTDKRFQGEVVAKMREWTDSGLMPAETPKLVYEAANFIARGYKPDSMKQTSSANRPTSQAPSSVSMNANKGSKVPDSDQRIMMAKNMGISGERMTEFKKFLSDSPEGYYDRK